MKILVTGGTGYIGGRIVSHLLSSGDHFIIVGYNKKEDAEYFDHVRSQMTWIDLLDDESLNNACRKVDVIVHLAAVNEIVSAQDPEKALQINTLGTLKLLYAAKKTEVKRFIYFSTAHVYGSPLEGEIAETLIPKPTHPYAITHKHAEDYVLAASLKNEIKGLVFRLSNSFGTPIKPDVDRWTLLVNDLCRQITRDKKITLKSNGMQYRDFITLTDVCRAVDHFIDLSSDSYDDGLFNLGGDFSISVYEMAKKISLRAGEILGFCPDIERPATGEPGIKLDYSIKKLIETGFTLSKNIDAEIDNTLLFCNKYFN